MRMPSWSSSGGRIDRATARRATWAFLAGAALLTQAARAACPQDLCDCLGKASGYAVVATEDVRVGGSSITFTRLLETSCAPHLRIAGAASFNSDTLTQSLFATAGPGSAGVELRGRLRVLADVATGGGTIVQGPQATVSGAVDDTGGHPGVAACQEAIDEMTAAAATLAALAPTRDLGTITLRDTDLTLTADPGVNVWTANSIRLLGSAAVGGGAALTITLDPATDVVVINTPHFRARRAWIDGDPQRVMINVTGTGDAVVIQDSGILPTVLAASRVVRQRIASDVNAFGRQVRIRGGHAVSFLDCPQ
jgi:hypothetical protein